MNGADNIYLGPNEFMIDSKLKVVPHQFNQRLLHIKDVLAKSSKNPTIETYEED